MPGASPRHLSLVAAPPPLALVPPVNEPTMRPALSLVPPMARRTNPVVGAVRRIVARLRLDSGQAAVEFVAVLPLVVAILVVLWQALLAGEAVWEARVASRAAARENAFGGDAERAAREHLSAKLERGLHVRAQDDGDVTVTVRVPRVLPGIDPGRVSSTSHFRPQGA